MILKYVWTNFSRRRVRTILMILALAVSVGLIVAMSATLETVRRSNVNLIANEVGRFDLAISQRDTSPDPFINIDEVLPQVLAADPQITAVYPRIQSEVEFNLAGELVDGWLLALDPAIDEIGHIEVISGTYTLGNGQVAVLAEMANVHGLRVGDTIDVAYRFPLTREIGEPEPSGTSQRRASQRFTISSIVRQDGVTDNSVNQGILISLADAQQWLQLPGRAQQLVATVIPNIYESNNAEVAALNMRDITRAVQSAIGDEYNYEMAKAVQLDNSAEAFLGLQALISVYGLASLGVVGLLVYTLVMTNVQEQRRDMAILRILGSQRRYLFYLVVAEVLVIGLIGISLGVLFGQLVTRFAVVPLIANQLRTIGVTDAITPQVTAATFLPVAAVAFIILIVSALLPAQEASRTKVMHAINPSVADNIQIEEISRLRERRPDLKLFLAGVALLCVFGLIASFQLIETFGNLSLEVIVILITLGMLVLGVGFVFFIMTVPFERLVLLVLGLVMPRQVYFARRNVGRGETRNTLISLLVLFSSVLPTLLATTAALDLANRDNTLRLAWGAPLSIEAFGRGLPEEDITDFGFRPSYLTRALPTIPDIDQTVGLSEPYNTTIADTIGLRRAPLHVIGISNSPENVVYHDYLEMNPGSEGAFDRLAADPTAIIVSQGLADYLAIELGSLVRIEGEGLDHFVLARVVGIGGRIPGIDNFGRSRNQAQGLSTALMSLDGYQALRADPDLPFPLPDERILSRVLATMTPEAVIEQIRTSIYEQSTDDQYLFALFVEEELEFSRQALASQRILLLALTMLSFTTAVFGVFAVIYVTVYARRLEIGMLKAIGMRRRELTGMLIVESITMTLGAALAGMTAGAIMGYVAGFGQYTLQGLPMRFAFDTVVAPFIVILVVLASVVGAAFSARRIVKRQAVEILRMH